MDKEAWWATKSPWGHKGSDATEQQRTHTVRIHSQTIREKTGRVWRNARMGFLMFSPSHGVTKSSLSLPALPNPLLRYCLLTPSKRHSHRCATFLPRKAL